MSHLLSPPFPLCSIFYELFFKYKMYVYNLVFRWGRINKIYIQMSALVLTDKSYSLLDIGVDIVESVCSL